MSIVIGKIAALFRHPVKSMRGHSAGSATLGWYGLEGDRRLALRRVDDRSGFPWLTASKLPELLCHEPVLPPGTDAALPERVRTPDGRELELFGDELASEIGARCGTPVQMTHLRQGIFDEAGISVITTATIEGIGALAGVALDVRRFRPNILLDSAKATVFEENAWVGGVLRFGDAPDAAAVHVTNRDLRCVMVNFDPDTAHANPAVLKVIAQANDVMAGVYASAIRPGPLAVGQTVSFEPLAFATPSPRNAP